MYKIKKITFNAILLGIIFLLLFIAFHYNNSYWHDFLKAETRTTPIPFKFQLLVYIAQASCFVLAVSLFVFRKRIYNKRKEFTLFLITLLFCFLFLEILSRIYICNIADPSVQSKILIYGQCGFPSMFTPHQYLNYYGTPNYKSLDEQNTHNSMGYRGPEVAVPKSDGVYRIATIGGSSTYTDAIKDWKKDFARQLEKRLQEKYNYDKIEVVNAGMGGWSSWESLINFQFKLLDLEPDLIIVYHGTNDVHPRLVNPLYYQGDNSGRIKQWEAESFPIILHSTFIRLILGISPSGLGQYVDAETSMAMVIGTGFNEKLNGTPLETLEKNEPIYFERNIRNIVAIAKEHDVDVLLATWAHSNQMDDYAATPHYEFAFKETNEVIKDVGSTHGIPVYDFAAKMPMDKEYWFDGRHVNEKGVELKGKLFADYIYSNKLIHDEIISFKSELI